MAAAPDAADGLAPHEARHLRAAAAIVSDASVATADTPQGIALPLLLAPAHALGGETGARLLLAAFAALALVLGAALARRVVPEPFPTRAALAVGLSAPALAAAAVVDAGAVAGAALAAAVLLALRVREDARRRDALASAALLAFLPWLGLQYALPAVPVAAALGHWTLRHGRRVLALLEAEVLAASLVAFLTANDALYARAIPRDTGLAGPEWVARLGDSAPLWLRAPVLALAAAGAYALWRSRRERLARVVPEQREVEAAAGLAGAAGVAGAAVAAPLLALPPLVALVAWGWQRMPRAALALGALTVLGSAATLTL
ncbi:MAG TPA: hypothetical protein VM266_12645 [Solirubrobacteraceae bacterium]|nr:hypothetical protein [Solirubrobacteraceae bacterium]